MHKKLFIVFIVTAVFLSGIVVAQKLIFHTNMREGLNDPGLFISLGDFLLKNGYPEHAEEAYLKALDIEPENKVALNNLGYYYREKNPLLAEDYFKKAIYADPAYETALNNLALLYHSLGQYDGAIATLRKLTEMKPDSPNYNYDLAINLAKRFYHKGNSYSDLKEALVYFKKAYQINPDFEHSLENIKVLEEIRRTIENR